MSRVAFTRFCRQIHQSARIGARGGGASRSWQCQDFQGAYNGIPSLSVVSLLYNCGLYRCADLKHAQHQSEMANENNEDETKPPASCKFFHQVIDQKLLENDAEDENENEKVGMRCKIVEQAEKQKVRGPKSPTEDQQQPASTRQYTVVSKMPKDTKLQVNVKCPKCDLKFFKANLLEEHLKLHDGKKAKQCPVCQKSFNSNYHFKTHMRTHSNVKPFCCAVKVGAHH